MSGHDQSPFAGDGSRHGLATAPTLTSMRRSASAKLSGRHLEKIAIVYVRQSSPRQVFDHKARENGNTPWRTRPRPSDGPKTES